MGRPATMAGNEGTQHLRLDARLTHVQTPALDRGDQDHIGRQLRAMYEALLQEPIPGRILVLIARLERQDREQGHGS